MPHLFVEMMWWCDIVLFLPIPRYVVNLANLTRVTNKLYFSIHNDFLGNFRILEYELFGYLFRYISTFKVNVILHRSSSAPKYLINSDEQRNKWNCALFPFLKCNYNMDEWNQNAFNHLKAFHFSMIYAMQKRVEAEQKVNKQLRFVWISIKFL